jgi:Kef-type K+ transport system membrane component KefB
MKLSGPRRQRAPVSAVTLTVGLLTVAVILFGWVGPAAAFDFSSMHRDPIAPVILGVTGILFMALIGRFSARRLGLPTVLGELTMGIIVGNIAYWLNLDLFMVLREGPAIFDTVQYMLHGEPVNIAARHALGETNAVRLMDVLQGPYGNELLQVAHTVDVFSRYGVIFLLFMVGLDTSLEEMRRVGTESMRVALIGVLLPFLLGFVCSRCLLPDIALHTSLFLGAALGATSVGISVRVLDELGLTQSSTARIILGAAVFDDILGLLMLAIVSGIVVSGDVDLMHMTLVILLASLFLGSALFLGPYFLRYIIRLVGHLDLIEAKMFVSYLFVMVLAWLASMSGLATIVGAFTAGVILHDAYFEHWGRKETHAYTIKDLIMPLEVILVPIFFVLMGIQVKLEAFWDWSVIILAGGLLASAIIGKLACGWGVARSQNRLAIGAGMLPRGEVGLIFAIIGKGLGVIDDALFSAIVLMVILTTLISPPLLKFALRRESARVRNM